MKTPYLEHLNRSTVLIKSKSKFSFEQTAKRIQNSGMNISIMKFLMFQFSDSKTNIAYF